MGSGASTAYRPDYLTVDPDTGDVLRVVWYPHRNAPSLVPWTISSAYDPPSAREHWVAEVLSILERSNGS